MYIHTQNFVRVSESEIRALYPNTSFATPFAPPSDYVYIFPTPQPAYDPVTQSVQPTTPEMTVLGHWEERWNVVELYPSQAAKDAANAAHLATLKAAKNAEINAARLAANFTTFTHAGKVIACDQLSRSDIDGANGFVSIYGALPPGWPGGWKAVDNTYVTIATLNDWKSFYTSMFAAGNANFAKAQGLKATLAAATTAEQISAIQWGAA